MLAAHLKTGQNPAGLVGIFPKNQHDFTGAGFRRLSIFAAHGSLIIENAVLFSAAQQLSITDELIQL